MSRTLLLAHAVAWRLYDETYRPFQNGKISIALNSDWSQPKDPTKKEDRDAAEVYLEVSKSSKIVSKLKRKNVCVHVDSAGLSSNESLVHVECNSFNQHLHNHLC